MRSRASRSFHQRPFRFGFRAGRRTSSKHAGITAQRIRHESRAWPFAAALAGATGISMGTYSMHKKDEDTWPPHFIELQPQKQWLYHFQEGNKDMKEILGGKGANLAEMSRMGIRVPPGFTITAEVCDYYNKNNGTYPEGLMEEVFGPSLDRLERELDNGTAFGNNQNPLLLSVRSGAAISMPGMMDTVLNLGLNDESVEVLARKSGGNYRFAYDAYRRLIQMFGNVVLGFDLEPFEAALSQTKKKNGYKQDVELTASDLKKLIAEYKRIYRRLHPNHEEFPQDPRTQLKMAIEAVFKSWNTPRAVAYRKINDIRGLLGTAVNVQCMVFGNMGETSGTGVCFTRNPSSGENNFYGEFLMNAQGEDVVAGVRTPQSISQLAEIMPDCYQELVNVYQQLELHYRDMQDMEFTIQEGKLFILQTRTGKRTAAAAIRIACEMVDEGLITEKEALMRIDPAHLEQMLHPQFDPHALYENRRNVLGKGLPASPGAGVGKVVFSADRAVELHDRGEKVILVRQETSPEDIMGMNVAQGILTLRGGMTSHAAVIARGMGTCCVAGCGDAILHEHGEHEHLHVLEVGGQMFQEGDTISLDGATGKIYNGAMPVVDPDLTSGNFGKILSWADKYRDLGVRANADTPADARKALELGAGGIGLVRTEHMFFDEARIQAVRELILCCDDEQRAAQALAKILPYQRDDFIGIFEVMQNRTVTVRLLDPPLHEFLPKEEHEQVEIARDLGVSLEDVQDKTDELSELNPMLGHRGCRLGITMPIITEMQTRAIIEAAIEVSKRKGVKIVPEIMVPLVGNVKEFVAQKELICRVADEIIAQSGMDLKYLVGSMIEVPRAALTADEIANEAAFFSFGTNDLTQMTCGFSRDDSGSFLKEYVNLGIYHHDPFQVLDQGGVGKLIEIGVENGRRVNPKLVVGICGEHGGEPKSVDFCHRHGFNYVSCSPFRVPVARLSAAQAALREEKK